ncbi:MAG: indolepyruvate oxidoreductase subunit beta [Bacillota bacterium]
MGVNSVKSIMFVGVGGQGTLLASRIIGNVLMSQNFDVKVSEIHGMSQRGGSVVTYVKYGDKVHSPIVEKGEADFIVAFEELEAFRYFSYLKNDGEIIVSTGRIDPMPVIIGKEKYPDDIIAKMKSAGAKVNEVAAHCLALEAGSSKTINTVLIGVLAKKSGIDKQIWLTAIAETVAEKFLKMNIDAFELGYSEGELV